MLDGELPERLHGEIKKLCAEGDQLAQAGNLAEAWRKYTSALKMVPDPVHEWEAATWILAAMGDLQFEKPDFQKSLEIFKDAVRCAGGLGNTFIHLRLGECYFELGDMTRAGDNLTRAYMGGGLEAFENEDPKYFAYLKTILEPPAGQTDL